MHGKEEAEAVDLLEIHSGGCCMRGKHEDNDGSA